MGGPAKARDDAFVRPRLGPGRGRGDACGEHGRDRPTSAPAPARAARTRRGCAREQADREERAGAEQRARGEPGEQAPGGERGHDGERRGEDPGPAPRPPRPRSRPRRRSGSATGRARPGSRRTRGRARARARPRRQRGAHPGRSEGSRELRRRRHAARAWLGAGADVLRPAGLSGTGNRTLVRARRRSSGVVNRRRQSPQAFSTFFRSWSISLRSPCTCSEAVEELADAVAAAEREPRRGEVVRRVGLRERRRPGQRRDRGLEHRQRRPRRRLPAAGGSPRR